MPAPTIQIYQHVVIVDSSGHRQVLGSLSDGVGLGTAFEGEVFRQTYNLAGSTVITAWTAGTGPLTGFSFLWIRANTENIMVELITDTNNGVGDERYTVRLKKNVAFILADDTSFANYTTAFAGGTLDVIDQIKIGNLDSEETVVELVIGQ